MICVVADSADSDSGPRKRPQHIGANLKRTTAGEERPSEASPIHLSDFGQRFGRGTGTYQLMADLSVAAQQPDSLMLGGGNPAHIPEMEIVFREELARLAQEPSAFRRWGGCYSAPEGDLPFREAVAELLAARCGWRVTSANVALTAGSQSAFFMLLNLFAGTRSGAQRSIWLPITPE